VLRYNRSAYVEAVSAGTADPNEGVEDAFEVVAELSEKYVKPNPHHEKSDLLVFERPNGLAMSLSTPPPTGCSTSSGNRHTQLPILTPDIIFLGTLLVTDEYILPIKMSMWCLMRSVYLLLNIKL
jgi:hypothetical protein